MRQDRRSPEQVTWRSKPGPLIHKPHTPCGPSRTHVAPLTRRLLACTTERVCVLMPCTNDKPAPAMSHLHLPRCRPKSKRSRKAGRQPKHVTAQHRRRRTKAGAQTLSCPAGHPLKPQRQREMNKLCRNLKKAKLAAQFMAT